VLLCNGSWQWITLSHTIIPVTSFVRTYLERVLDEITKELIFVFAVVALNMHSTQKSDTVKGHVIICRAIDAKCIHARTE